MTAASKFPRARAFLFDVDRTLTTTQGEITPATEQTLQDISQAGFKLGVCTGRSYAELRAAVLPLFSKESAHIVSGGAQVISFSGTVIWEQVLPSEQVHHIAEKAAELGADFGFSQGLFYAGTPRVIAYKKNHRWSVETILANELTDWSTCLLTIASLNPEVEAFVESLSGVEVKGMVNAIGKPYYDITPAGVTKRNGAQHWADYWQLDISEIMAFGDSENDLEVLDFVGTGVAMGNAIPAVKSVADQVIGHADEDGITQFFQEFLASQ